MSFLHLVLLVLFAAYAAASIQSGAWREPLPAESNKTFHGCSSTGDATYFWEYNDWGAVYRHQHSLREFCTSTAENATSIKCNDDMVHCEGRHIRVKIGKKADYPDDTKRNPRVGSLHECGLSKDYPPAKRGWHALTDWFPELKNFADTPSRPPKCDVFFNETVVITRGDSQANVYHNLCDFVNLYLSVYIGGVDGVPLDNITVLYWEPERGHFRTMMQDLYHMFTSKPLVHIHQYYEKTICFRHAIFSVKPRAINTFYYNQRMPPNCIGGAGSFMRKFSDSAVFSMLGEAAMIPTRKDKLVVTMLSRSKGRGHTSGTRHVLNELDLAKAARKRFPLIEFHVEGFDYIEKVPFLEQITKIRRSDVLVGMHGAGLAHMIFLNEWAAVYEVHHCDDIPCYRDLSRLLALFHTSGGDADIKEKLKPDVPQHLQDAKFWNYRFKEEAFLSHLDNAISHVLAHPKFPGLRNSKDVDEL